MINSSTGAIELCIPNRI